MVKTVQNELSLEVLKEFHNFRSCSSLHPTGLKKDSLLWHNVSRLSGHTHGEFIMASVVFGVMTTKGKSLNGH